VGKSQRLGQVAPGADLVAKKMFGHSHHALAEQPIVQIAISRRQIMESLRKRQRGAVSAAASVVEMQTRESAQLTIGVAQSFRDLERLRERSPHFGRMGCR